MLLDTTTPSTTVPGVFFLSFIYKNLFLLYFGSESKSFMWGEDNASYAQRRTKCCYKVIGGEN